MKPRGPASTVDKAIQILITLSHEEGEMGTTDIGRKLGVHKATISRIILKLAEYEMVYKNRETGKYGLGPAIYQLATTMVELNFRQAKEVSRPLIDSLRNSTGETVTLEMWLGNSTIPIYSALSPHPLTAQPPPGEPLALHAAAGAKVILAHMHPDRADLLLDGELTRFTGKTITDRQLLKQSLTEYNKQGFAIDHEEFHEGICGVAVPVYNHLRQPFAALVVLIPSSRSSQAMDSGLIATLKKTAATITKELLLARARDRSSAGGTKGL